MVSFASYADDHLGRRFSGNGKPGVARLHNEAVVAVVIAHNLKTSTMRESHFGYAQVRVGEHDPLLPGQTVTQRLARARALAAALPRFSPKPPDVFQWMRLPNARKPTTPAAMIPRQTDIQSAALSGCAANVATW